MHDDYMHAAASDGESVSAIHHPSDWFYVCDVCGNGCGGTTTDHHQTHSNAH